MSALSPIRSDRLAALRAEVRAIESAGISSACEYLPFGVEEMDRRLPGGGLAVAALHEMTGERPNLGDDAAATLFVAGTAGRRAGTRGDVLWAFSRRDLFAPGLALAEAEGGVMITADLKFVRAVVASPTYAPLVRPLTVDSN